MKNSLRINYVKIFLKPFSYGNIGVRGCASLRFRTVQIRLKLNGVRYNRYPPASASEPYVSKSYASEPYASEPPVSSHLFAQSSPNSPAMNPYFVPAPSSNTAPSPASTPSSRPASTPASPSASRPPAVPDSSGASSTSNAPRTSGSAPASRDSRSTTVVPATPDSRTVFSAMDLMLGPKNVIARPGSEVILTAGVRDRSGYLRTNQRIDWSISPESVGHFSKIQEREPGNVLVFDFVKPQILSDTQAVTSTSRSEIILDRGTPYLNDDIVVRRGESWVSVSSPREGVTLVTASAPKIDNSQNKTQTAKIVWIDAAVKLPESKVLDFGSTYTLNTVLRRVSDEQPLARWGVRYEITGCSTAAFEDGNKMMEVYTNARGEAKITMKQPVARQEETLVSVQIIRPAEGDFREPVVVQDSQLHYRWVPNTVNIQKTMPQETYIGSIVPAMIYVTNLTDQPLRNVRIVDVQQPGLVLKGASPEGQDALDGRQWLVETIAPHETYSIQLNYRVEQPGSYQSVARVQTQKMGNELVVECAAALSAGSEPHRTPRRCRIGKRTRRHDPFGGATAPLPARP